MRKVKAPSGEIAWVSYVGRDGEVQFIITSKPTRDYYFLYECTDDGLKKIARGKSPLKLEEDNDICRRAGIHE